MIHELGLLQAIIVASVDSGRGRPSFDELWQDLRAVSADIRPDWDLSTPGLREAWNAGDYSSFHGWNKMSPETERKKRWLGPMMAP